MDAAGRLPLTPPLRRSDRPKTRHAPVPRSPGRGMVTSEDAVFAACQEYDCRETGLFGGKTTREGAC
jgi:hypothetical protein